MRDDGQVTDSPDPAPADPPARRRRPTVDEVFGDVLPDTTTDERDLDPRQGEHDRDQWYRDNRPPHHGG
jgi:hypothetical protein